MWSFDLTRTTSNTHVYRISKFLFQIYTFPYRHQKFRTERGGVSIVAVSTIIHRIITLTKHWFDWSHGKDYMGNILVREGCRCNTIYILHVVIALKDSPFQPMKIFFLTANIHITSYIQHLFQHICSSDHSPMPFHFLLHSLSITQSTEMVMTI